MLLCPMIDCTEYSELYLRKLKGILIWPLWRLDLFINTSCYVVLGIEGNSICIVNCDVYEKSIYKGILIIQARP